MTKAPVDLKPYYNMAEAGSIWIHAKTGGEYMVTAHGLIESNLHPAVIYRPMLGEPVSWIRPATEFFDGRFVRKPFK